MCTTYILRHIRSLPANKIITTSDMLIYGKRASVDSSLCRMVQSGFLARLTRGVFIQSSSILPHVGEIAAAKARVLGVRIVEHAINLLRKLKMLPAATEQIMYAKSGGTSSFLTIHGRVHFKGVCAKKLALAETHIGQAIYALWHLGKRACTENDVSVVCSRLNRTERKDLWLAASIIPAWLNELCRVWHSKAQIAIRDDDGLYANSRLLKRNTANPFALSSS